MELLEASLFNDDLQKLLFRFAFNATSVLLLVVFAYHANQKKKDYVFALLMMNLMVFFICFTLKKLDLGLGMALGLFAIFTILRYRTDAIKIKDMAYLFIVIGVAVINSLSNGNTTHTELAFVNLAIFGITLLLERLLRTEALAKQSLVYDKPELLSPLRRSELIDDIASRTGLDVRRVEVCKLDLLKKYGNITVYFVNQES